MPYTITLDGADRLLAALDHEPQIAAPILRTATERALLRLVKPLATYPPAQGTYRRTGTLGRLWTSAQPEFTSNASGFEGSLGNTTPYGPFVQGSHDEEPHQAWMHKDTWKTVDDVAKANEGAIQGEYEAALAQIEAAIANEGGAS